MGKTSENSAYYAFVTRGRVLSEREQHPFRHALRRLRRALNDPMRLERFIAEGVVEIILIADETRNRQFKGHFQRECTGVGGRKLQKPRPNPVIKWVADEMKRRGIPPKKYRGFMSIASAPGAREDEVRRYFENLRDTLNNRVKYNALAALGPCKLSLWDPNDKPLGPDECPDILITRCLPGGSPPLESDYSIVPDGGHPDAVNGLWHHG